MKIGLFAGSCKPCHIGHWKMLTTASQECDSVIAYISMSNRSSHGITVNWDTMKNVWELFLLKNLPQNVTVDFVSNPIKSVYVYMGAADVDESQDTFVLYGDVDDLENAYPVRSRKKYFPFLYKKSLIKLRAFKREGELDVSSSLFRSFVNAGERTEAIKLLPNIPERDEMYDYIIKSSVLGARKRLPFDVLALRKEPLSQDVNDAIVYVSKMLASETDWLYVKKQIMLTLGPANRQLFSTRDKVTKKHFPFNEFENNVRKLWKQLTGNTLQMPQEKIMKEIDPDLYV